MLTVTQRFTAEKDLREADLDYRGGRRNARRLVFGSDGSRWVTMDHYETFQAVPR